MQILRCHDRLFRCALLLALAGAPACKSGSGARPNVPGTLLDQQTVKISKNTESTVQLGAGTHTAVVVFPAGATQSSQDVQVALSSGVDKQGATPANGTVIQIITINITFVTPAVLQETLAPPPPGKIYVAASAAPGDAAWTLGAPARLVGPVATGDGDASAGAQVYEIDVRGSGIWTIVLVDVPDGGGDSGGAGAAGGGAGGGGAGGSDAATELSFDLPAKTYNFNPSQWQVPAGNSVKTMCGVGEVVTDCCNPPALMPKPDCAATPLSCDSGVCTAHVTVSASSLVSLKQEVPALASLGDQSLTNMSLRTLTYAVTNSLNVQLPPLDLYLAPDGVTDPKDARATKIGTVPALAVGSNPSGDVTKEPNADATFATFGEALGTPFTLIATTTVVIPSGSPMPTGMGSVTINGQVHAKLAM